MSRTQPSRTIGMAYLASFLTLWGLGMPRVAFAIDLHPPTVTQLPVEMERGRGPDACTPSDRAPEQSLTALLPPDQNAMSTVEGNPTFFFYLPPTSAEKAELLVYDNRDTLVYKVRLAISGEPGIISLELPAFMNLEPLQINNFYRWSFALICDPLTPSENLAIMGTIRRVEPSGSLLAQLENAPLRDRPRLYAEAGMWQDALASLAGLLRVNPNDPALIGEGKNLLQLMQLDPISQESLLGG